METLQPQGEGCATAPALPPLAAAVAAAAPALPSSPPAAAAGAPLADGVDQLPAPVLVDAAVDRTPGVRTAALHVQQLADSSAVGAVRLCLSLQALQFALEQACQSLRLPRPPKRLVEHIRAWLPAVIGAACAKRHLKTWKSTKRLYATPADLAFWQQLLSAMQPTTMQLEAAPADASTVAPPRFRLELLRFLHLEYDAIAAMWPSAQERHALWRECCLSERRLNGIVLWVGQRIQQHHAEKGSAAADLSSTGFHPTTQCIFDQQLQLQTAHGLAARQRAATQLAKSLQHYGEDGEELEKEASDAEVESDRMASTASAAASGSATQQLDETAAGGQQPDGDVEMEEEDGVALVGSHVPCDAAPSLSASIPSPPSQSAEKASPPAPIAMRALRFGSMDDDSACVPRRSERLVAPTPLTAVTHSLPPPSPVPCSKKRAPKADRHATAKAPKLHFAQATPHLTCSSSPPRSLPPPTQASDQHWHESYLDGFESLMDRYPLLLRRGACLEPSATGGLPFWQQQRSPLLDSMALVVCGVERVLSSERVSDVHTAIHADLAASLVDAQVPKTIMQQQLDDSVVLCYDTLDTIGKGARAKRFCFATDQRYFLADLELASLQTHMAELAAQQGLPLQHRSFSPLDGGILWHLQQEESTIEMPHGVADWTLSYHLDNCADDDELVDASTSAGAAAAAPAPASVPSSAARPSSSTEHPRSTRPPYPIYFHCETHRAGAVNLRLPDVSIHVSRTEARMRATRVVSRPVHWLCVLPEEENMRRFHDTMAGMQRALLGRKPVTAEERYCIDRQRQPSLSSIEPLLRAGVAMLLLEQQEGDLVVLQPGVPHFLLTPPRACKASRNWMTAESLVHAAVRVLQGQQGERAEWFAALCCQPLRCLLLALRRMQHAHPDAFELLATHPTSGTQLRYALHRALSSTDAAAQAADPLPTADAAQADELRLMAQHLLERTTLSAAHMSPHNPTHEWQQTLSRSASSGADSATQAVLTSPGRARMDEPMDVLAAAASSTCSDSDEVNPAAEVLPVGQHDSIAGQASSSPSFLPSGLEDSDLIRRCRAFRVELFRRLAHDCPLSSVLPELKRLLLSRTLPATVQEMCADLEQRPSDRAALPLSALGLRHSTHARVKAIDAAHRQRHMRAAKQEQLDQSAQRARTSVLASYHTHGLKQQDIWMKLTELDERITQLCAPAIGHSSPPGAYNLSHQSAWSTLPHAPRSIYIDSISLLLYVLM